MTGVFYVLLRQHWSGMDTEMSQHRKSIVQKIIIPPLLLEIEPAPSANESDAALPLYRYRERPCDSWRAYPCFASCDCRPIQLTIRARGLCNTYKGRQGNFVWIFKLSYLTTVVVFCPPVSADVQRLWLLQYLYVRQSQASNTWAQLKLMRVPSLRYSHG